MKENPYNDITFFVVVVFMRYWKKQGYLQLTSISQQAQQVLQFSKCSVRWRFVREKVFIYHNSEANFLGHLEAAEVNCEGKGEMTPLCSCFDLIRK